MVSCCLICLFMRNRFISCHYLNIPWSQRYTHLSYLVGFSLLLCQPPPRTGVGPIGLSIHCGGASKVARSLIAKCQTQDQKNPPPSPCAISPFPPHLVWSGVHKSENSSDNTIAEKADCVTQPAAVTQMQRK